MPGNVSWPESNGRFVLLDRFPFKNSQILPKGLYARMRWFSDKAVCLKIEMETHFFAFKSCGCN